MGNDKKKDDEEFETEIELKDVTDHHLEMKDEHHERKGSFSDEDTHHHDQKKMVKEFLHDDDKKKAAEKEDDDAGSESGSESEEEKPWAEKSGKEKCYWTLNLPLVWLRKVTIPPADKKDFDNYFVIGWPWLGIPI